MTLGFLVKEQDGTSSGRTGTVHQGTLGRLGLQEAPYRSGLAPGSRARTRGCRKASPASRVDAAVLTADRIACLDLSATELMVLSACETGLGDITREEGRPRAALGVRRIGGAQCPDEPVEDS